MRIDRALDEYRVPFTGLKDGNHGFRFLLGNEFFAAFEFSEIDEAEIRASVELEKSSTMMVFLTELEGSVQVDCDRCGDRISQPVSGAFRLVVKFGEETESTDDDVLVLGPQEYEVDLSLYFYEYAHLMLPARRVHEEIRDCNQDVLRKLDEMRVESDAEANWIAMKNMVLDNPEPFEDDEEE
jgi:uncharacterized metal-binding protein YceD (DUF177 family)